MTDFEWKELRKPPLRIRFIKLASVRDPGGIVALVASVVPAKIVVTNRILPWHNR